MKQGIYTLITALALFILSCEENVRIVEPHEELNTGKIILGIENAPPEVSLVIARLSRNGFHDLTLSLTISDSGQSARGTLENVAAGIWHLRVDAYDDSNVIRYTGETNVNVLPGDTTRAHLELLPASGIVEIHVTWGGYSNRIGLMLHLTFDSTLQDSSGNGNHGAAIHPLYTADRWGDSNAAYLFDGFSNFITVANSPSLNPVNQLSIAFWYRVDSITNNYSALVTKTEGGYPFNTLAREFVLELKASSIYPYFKLFSAGDGGDQHEVTTPGHTMHEWHHVVAIIDRVKHVMQIWVDGTIAGSVTDSYSSIYINSHPLLIGWTEETWEQYSIPKGAMDELRIYNSALNADQVLALYNSH